MCICVDTGSSVSDSFLHSISKNIKKTIFLHHRRRFIKRHWKTELPTGGKNNKKGNLSNFAFLWRDERFSLFRNKTRELKFLCKCLLSLSPMHVCDQGAEEEKGCLWHPKIQERNSTWIYHFFLSFELMLFFFESPFSSSVKTTTSASFRHSGVIKRVRFIHQRQCPIWCRKVEDLYKPQP